jgi:hypothetical protein
VGDRIENLKKAERGSGMSEKIRIEQEEECGCDVQILNSKRSEKPGNFGERIWIQRREKRKGRKENVRKEKE